MTSRRPIYLRLPFLLAFLVSGCGSISNLTGGPWLTRKSGPTVPVGGVILDAQAITYPFFPPSQYDSTVLSILTMFGGLIDLPFCIAIDILTLPYTIPKSIERTPSGERPEPGREKPAKKELDIKDK
jgi:uncharacterized protein YceK